MLSMSNLRLFNMTKKHSRFLQIQIHKRIFLRGRTRQRTSKLASQSTNTSGVAGTEFFITEHHRTANPIYLMEEAIPEQKYNIINYY